MIDNLAAIGIEAEEEPDPETYFAARRRCLPDLPGRLVRRLPDVRQLHVRHLRHRRHRREQLRLLLGAEFDELVDEAKRPPTPTSRPTLFQDAEKILLNDKIGVVPINWYKGD